MIKTDKEELLIGLMSDSHVPSRTHEISRVVVNDFLEKKVDYVFHLGDFTSIQVYKNLLETFGKDKVIGIIGNMDEDEELKEILPKTVEFELYGKKVFMTHGMGGPNIIIKRLNKKFDLTPFDIVIFGHTHHPVNEIWRDGKLYLNPGTTTPIDGKLTVESSYGFLKISKEKVEPKIIHL